MAGKKRSPGLEQAGEPALWLTERLKDALGSSEYAIAQLDANGMSFSDRPNGMDASVAEFLKGITRDATSVFGKKARTSRVPFTWALSEEQGLQDLVAALPQALVQKLNASAFHVFFRRGRAGGDLLLIARSDASEPPPAMEKLFECQGMAQVLFDDMPFQASETPAEFAKITRRERECLGWSAEGKTSEEIAMILSLSTHTVNHYLLSAIKKLNAVNRMHAIAVAFRTGVLTVNPDRDPV
jgi:DNA-binding CsgD family transcriptional regulator